MSQVASLVPGDGGKPVEITQALLDRKIKVGEALGLIQLVAERLIDELEMTGFPQSDSGRKQLIGKYVIEACGSIVFDM